MTTHHHPSPARSCDALRPDQFARLHRYLVGQARRQVDDADEAEDIAQETLIAAWQAGVGWSPAKLDRVLADRCRGCWTHRQAGSATQGAHTDEPMQTLLTIAPADVVAVDARLEDVELRLTIVEGLRRSAVGELGVAVFALRRAGLRPADVRAVIGGSPKAVNDALAMLGRIARRVLGSGPASDRPADQPRERAAALLPPPPTASATTLPAVPPALAQTHPIAAALVRAGAPVAVSPAVVVTAATAPASRPADANRAVHCVAPPATATTTRGERLRAQQQARARAVERAGRRLEEMRHCRQQARTPDERVAADARLAAAAVRYERARAVLGDLERQLAASPVTSSPPHHAARPTNRGRQ